MIENVMEILEVRHDIDVLLETVRAGVTALETATTKIHIPTREMAKIQTAMRKMREAANYVENRAHNLSVKPDKITKTALKEALKDASQEQIERAYTILSGLNDAYETAKEESVEDVEIDDENFLPPPEWDEE
jgi:uncharacterized phage infection (PIP) family protein YhgE